MSLVLKKEYSPNLLDLDVYVDDLTMNSPDFFRVSDVPEILQKGKNHFKISLHPTNLVDGSQILIDVRGSDGNSIYYEVPAFLEKDKSRIVSIWIYHDKGINNTANGDATITIVGQSKVDGNGNRMSDKYKNVYNVRWSRVVSVDRDSKNTSEVIFNPTSLPTITVSESIETYKDIPQGSGLPTKTTVTGTSTKYIYKGNTPVVQATTTTPFNQEMIGGSLILHGANFITTARPTTSIPNPTNISSYTSSIVEVIDSQTVKLETPYSTTFDNRVGLVHTFTNVDSSRYRIEYFSTGSNTVSDSKRAFANITISGSDPIAGVVDKIKVSIKSDGSPSNEYELLNEVAVPFSSSYLLKIPVPTQHLRDVNNLQIKYLNSIGNQSRIETISDAIAFQGTKDIVQGTLSGFSVTPTAISSSVNMSDGTPALLLGKDGDISGSSVLIRQDFDGVLYTLLDTVNGLVDATNVGRQIVSDSNEYSRAGVDDGEVYVTKAEYPITFLPGETHLGINFSAKTTKGSATGVTGRIKFSIATAVTSSVVYQSGQDFYDAWNTPSDVVSYNMLSSGVGGVTSSLSLGPDGYNSFGEIPDAVRGRYCKIILGVANDITSGVVLVGTSTKITNISLFATREFGAAFASGSARSVG
jgi:hypothetical protein